MAEKESFERKMAELQEIVKDFEKGQEDLDETFSNFERGMKLIKSCMKTLDSVEKKVTVLVNKNGIISEEDF